MCLVQSTCRPCYPLLACASSIPQDSHGHVWLEPVQATLVDEHFRCQKAETTETCVTIWKWPQGPHAPMIRETKQILRKQKQSWSKKTETYRMMHDCRAEWTDVKRTHQSDIIVGISCQVAHLLLRNQIYKTSAVAIRTDLQLNDRFTEWQHLPYIHN
jgi:hypothetical protein